MKSRVGKCHQLIRFAKTVCSPHGTRIASPPVEKREVNQRQEARQTDGAKIKNLTTKIRSVK